MSEPRLIRKYVNRRLYDTVESRYVNLEDLRRVINAGGEIRVVDQASGRDITTTVLLQIIGEAERSGAPLLTADFLSALIRLSARERDPGLADRLRAALAENRSARVGL
jgi:polyhydroxyalkanoate synthesis repressor PhaR